MEKKLTPAEAGRLGGLKKNPNKGFGTNRELASKAPKKYWASKRERSLDKEMTVLSHAEKLAGDPR